MGQHDYNIADQAGASFLSDLNAVLAAIVSQNSGTTEPTTTFSFQKWMDETANLIKVRNAANSAWGIQGSLNGSVWIPYRDGSPAGTAFTRNTGTTDGTVPLIGAGDKLPSSIIPSAGIDFGDLKATGRDSAPSGWLLCFGQNVSRTTYSDLFTAIGTTFGAGDGSTTFGIPDLRGRVLAGNDFMGGVGAGRLTGSTIFPGGGTTGGAGGGERHTLSISELAAHAHTYDSRKFDLGGGLEWPTSGTANQAVFPGATAANGGGQAHNNVQPTIIVNWCIYTGVA